MDQGEPQKLGAQGLFRQTWAVLQSSKTLGPFWCQKLVNKARKDLPQFVGSFCALGAAETHHCEGTRCVIPIWDAASVCRAIKTIKPFKEQHFNPSPHPSRQLTSLCLLFFTSSSLPDRQHRAAAARGGGRRRHLEMQLQDGWEDAGDRLVPGKRCW